MSVKTKILANPFNIGLRDRQNPRRRYDALNGNVFLGKSLRLLSIILNKCFPVALTAFVKPRKPLEG
jgi:hypothetical protein